MRYPGNAGQDLKSSPSLDTAEVRRLLGVLQLSCPHVRVLGQTSIGYYRGAFVG